MNRIAIQGPLRGKRPEADGTFLRVAEHATPMVGEQLDPSGPDVNYYEYELRSLVIGGETFQFWMNARKTVTFETAMRLLAETVEELVPGG